MRRPTLRILEWGLARGQWATVCCNLLHFSAGANCSVCYTVSIATHQVSTMFKPYLTTLVEQHAQCARAFAKAPSVRLSAALKQLESAIKYEKRRLAKLAKG